MESKQQGILRLMIIMIFFCLSIFFLNNKKKFTTATYIDIENTKIDYKVNLSTEHMYQEIKTLLTMNDTQALINFLRQCKHSYLYDLVERIVTDTSLPLQSAEKVTIMYTMVLHCSPKKNIQYDLLDLLFHKNITEENVSSVLLLTQSEYVDIIPLFITWTKERQKDKTKKELIVRSIEQAFTQAVHENNYHAIETLFSKKVRIEKSFGTSLLWTIIEHQKDSHLLSLFIRHAHADINSLHNGKTLLVAAVEQNDLESVRVLLDHGAIVDRVDHHNTSALKVAIHNKFYPIEQLLREYGA